MFMCYSNMCILYFFKQSILDISAVAEFLSFSFKEIYIYYTIFIFYLFIYLFVGWFVYLFIHLLYQTHSMCFYMSRNFTRRFLWVLNSLGFLKMNYINPLTSSQEFILLIFSNSSGWYISHNKMIYYIFCSLSYDCYTFAFFTILMVLNV